MARTVAQSFIVYSKRTPLAILHRLFMLPCSQAERFAILKEIYLQKDHFNAEFIFLHMKKKGYGISRATVITH